MSCNCKLVDAWLQSSCFVGHVFSLKDDDSGDHDQDQGSPKDGEKEKNEDEDKEQNISKKKVSLRRSVWLVLAYASKLKENITCLWPALCQHDVVLLTF